jgi:predicted NBD/HSP70 family sugar kinase
MASLKEMRNGNRLRLLRALHLAGEADRAELARATGLSRATVSGLVGEAIARGHVVERHPERPASGGRRGRPGVLRLDPRGGVVAGVDLGHTHVHVVLADLRAEVVGERRVALAADAAPDVALDAAAALVLAVARSAGVEPERLLGVGMAVARPLDGETGRVHTAAPASRWAGVAPGEAMTRRLGVPVRPLNDGNLALLGEHVRGAARGARDVVYVKLSEGVGGGLLLDGALYAGARGVAGELGHVTVAPGGRICRCGNRGCLETVASASALARSLAPTHGDALTLPRLLELLDGGDVVVERGLRDVGRHVARALAPLCLALDVELVVVGGELGAASRRLLDAVRAELRKCATSGSVAVRPGQLGDRAEALGGVALALDQEDWLRDAGLIALERPDPVAAGRGSPRALGAGIG